MRLEQSLHDRGEEGTVVMHKNDDGQPQLAVEKLEEGAYVAFQLDMSHWANKFPETSPGREGMKTLQDKLHIHMALTRTPSLLEPCTEGETQLEVQYLANENVPHVVFGERFLNVLDWFFTRNPFSAESARRNEVCKFAEEDSKKYKRPEKEGESISVPRELPPWPEWVRLFKGTKQYVVLGTKLLVTQYTDAATKAPWNITKYAMRCVNTRYLYDLDTLGKAEKACDIDQEAQEAAPKLCDLDDALRTMSKGKASETDLERASKTVFAALRVPKNAIPVKVWRDVNDAHAPDPVRFAREVAFVKQ